MGSEDSVLPYLKTEIVIEAEHTSNGIPLWNSKEEDGPLEKWRAQNDPKAINRDLAARLRAKLGESVVQIFVEACKGAEFGELLQTSDQCSCYLSMTDSETLLAIPIKRSSGFSPAMNDLGNRKRTTQHGSPSLSAIIPEMLSAFESYTANTTDNSGRASIFYNTRSNPLMSFVYTSADSKTDEILKISSARGLEGDFPEKLLVADFTDEVRAAVQSRLNGLGTKDLKSASQVNNDPDLKRVLAIVKSIRNQEVFYATDVHERSEDSGYADSMRKFRNCTKFTNPTSECRAISALIRTAETGTAGGGNQSQEDRNIIGERDAFLGNFDKLDAPNFIQRYREGEMPLSELCKRLHTLSIAFEEHRQRTAFIVRNGLRDSTAQKGPHLRPSRR